MVSPRSFALVVLVAAATTLLFAHHANAGRVLKEDDLCDHTDHPDLCRTMVKSKVNAEKATQSAINNLIIQTRQAKTSASKVNTDKSLLDLCTEMYDDVLSNLETSIQNLKSHDKFSVQTNLSAVMSDLETCKDSFLEMEVKFPFEKINALLEDMTSNSLALAAEVH